MVQSARPNDLASYWMPFTANRQFKAQPRLMESAEGMYYRSTDGRKILDGTSGLWCVNAGHARREIAEALHKQVLTLDYAPAFQMGHPAIFEAASASAAFRSAALPATASSMPGLPASIICPTPSTLPSRRSRAASRNGARISPTSSRALRRCTILRPSPR